MILHCVFCNFKPDTTGAQKTSALQALADFSAGLEGVIAFDFGPNADFEGLSQDYSDGFVIRFSDRDALAHYAAHPTHKALGGQMRALCVDGPAGIMVFDLVCA